MPGYRHTRIAELVHAEVATLLRHETKDPRLVDISITRVDVSRDLKKAMIEYLPLGGGAISADLKDALRDVSRKFRGPVGRALGIRHAPELHFVPDTTTEAAIRVTQLISNISRQQEVDPDAPTELNDIDTVPPEGSE